MHREGWEGGEERLGVLGRVEGGVEMGRKDGDVLGGNGDGFREVGERW